MVIDASDRIVGGMQVTLEGAEAPMAADRLQSLQIHTVVGEVRPGGYGAAGAASTPPSGRLEQLMGPSRTSAPVPSAPCSDSGVFRYDPACSVPLFSPPPPCRDPSESASCVGLVPSMRYSMAVGTRMRRPSRIVGRCPAAAAR